jgi:Ca-activated chloride channel family protein
MNPAVPVLITTQAVRDPLPMTGNQQLAYVLLEVRPSEALAAATQLPLNVILAVDRSRSMQGPRIQCLKEALMSVIESLTPEDALTIVTYDDTVDLVVPAQLVADREPLLNAVALLDEGGGTLISLGMSLGLAEGRKFVGPERVSRMIVLTDGVTEGDEAHCLRLAQEAGDVGVPIIPIGYGADWDDAFLTELGELSSGPPPSYVHAPADITACLVGHVQVARQVRLRQVELAAKFVTGVTPHRITQVTPFIRPLDQTVEDGVATMRLGDIASEAVPAVLLELLIEPKKAGAFRLAQIEARIPGAEAPTVLGQADVVVTFSAGTARKPQIRPVVAHYAERVNVARIIARMLDDPAGAPLSEGFYQLVDGDTRELLQALAAGRPVAPEGRKALRELAQGYIKPRQG